MGTQLKQAESRELMLNGAAEHLRSALQLLDMAEAPAQVGAHVDLAIHQLEAELLRRGAERPGSSQASTAHH
jgi:hypothetical protein